MTKTSQVEMRSDECKPLPAMASTCSLLPFSFSCAEGLAHADIARYDIDMHYEHSSHGTLCRNLMTGIGVSTLPDHWGDGEDAR